MAPDLTIQMTGMGGVMTWVVPLVGVLLGGLISVGSTFGIEVWREAQKAKKLALAIASEVEANIRMLTFRNFLTHFRAARDEAAAGGTPIVYFSLGDDYFPICRAAVSDLGVLPGDAPFHLAEMLTLARSAKIDLDDLANPESEFRLATSEDLTVRYGQLVAIMEEFVRAGIMLVDAIDDRYPPTRARTWKDWDSSGPLPSAKSVAAS